MDKEATLRAFIKQCRKISTNFDLDELDNITSLLSSELYDEVGSASTNNFNLRGRYFDLSFAESVIEAYHSAVVITEGVAEIVATRERSVKVLPNGWKLIK